ncbi:hypothetical protein [uncultured Nocardioides sp.]|jgi:uncharacterized membrane protein|uniref:hypothetical protein n=1 Tax=uncultured Nocardioides sp. TaxID=198441 RepID=UPI0030F79895
MSERTSLVADVLASTQRLPLGVQVWVFLVLMPVNLAALVALGQPLGPLVAALAVGALAINGVVMVLDRGFSLAMALPHVALWVPLLGVVVYLLLGRDDVGAAYAAYLVVLLVVDAVSLWFDVPDAKRWLDGQRDTF